jgi:hypothetical protein
LNCHGRFGASGDALRNGTIQPIPAAPTKHDEDENGDYTYEHESGSSRLSDRGHKDFPSTVTRYLDDEKKRKLDDTALYRHMLDHISLDSIRLIELDPAYLGLSHSLYGYSPVISLFRRCNDKLL